MYSDYRIMPLDAVGVATPNKYHAEISIFALNKGLPVFCEKPDAMTHQERREVNEQPLKRILAMGRRPALTIKAGTTFSFRFACGVALTRASAGIA